MEKTYTRVSNSHTEMLTKVDTDMSDIALQVNVIDEGVKTLASRVDQDLVALDEWVTRRRNECDRTEAELVVANGKIALLEDRVREQRTALQLWWSILLAET